MKKLNATRVCKFNDIILRSSQESFSQEWNVSMLHVYKYTCMIQDLDNSISVRESIAYINKKRESVDMESSTKEPSAASRWHVLSSCLLIASVCGLTTAFGLLSPSFEGDLKFSPSEIALVASFGNLGTFSGFIAGLMIDNLGPRRAVFIGSVCIWFGMFFIWLSVEKTIASSVSSICVFIYIAQLGASTMSQASSSTAMLIMPSSAHGEIASIAKAYYGIAGGVLSSIAGTFYEDKEKGFILFASIFMPLATFFGGVSLDLLPDQFISFDVERKENIRTSLRPYYGHFGVLVTIILITASLYLSDNSGGPVVHQLFGAMVLVWVVSVLALRYVFYSPGSGNPSEVEACRGTSGAPSDTADTLIRNNRSSMIDEELIKYEMQAHALAEHQHNQSLNKQRKSGSNLEDAILPRGSNSGHEEFDHRISKISLFRASIASQYKSPYGEDLNVRPQLHLPYSCGLICFFFFSYGRCFKRAAFTPLSLSSPHTMAGRCCLST